MEGMGVMAKSNHSLDAWNLHGYHGKYGHSLNISLKCFLNHPFILSLYDDQRDRDNSRKSPAWTSATFNRVVSSRQRSESPTLHPSPDDKRVCNLGDLLQSLVI